MKAIILRKKGGAEQLRLEEVPVPKINDDEVLVKVKAASVNHLDIWIREGQFPIGYPIILGCEAAGDVAEAGKNVKSYKKGDKVVVMPSISCSQCEYCLAGHDNMCKNGKRYGMNVDGCYAEYVKALPQSLILMDDRINYEEAASVPIAFGTAWRVLINLIKIKPGETMLINAAGSGVGTAAVQIAKLAGATVVATAGTEEKLKKAKSLGADFAIDYCSNKDFEKEVMKVTNGKGADAAIEQIGSDMFTKSLGCIKQGGRMAVLGSTGGSKAEFDIRNFYRKNITLIGTSGVTRKEIKDVFELVKERKLKPVIGKIFQLKEASLAHRYMEERKNTGKIILKI